jgi:hypothetical protein
MPKGGGKYGDLAEMVHGTTGADAVLLIVLKGTDESGFGNGSGFSVVGNQDVIAFLPSLLRDMAQQIESDTRGDSNVDQI